MTIAEQILQHGDKTPVEVADIVGCDDTYVRLVRRRAAQPNYQAQRRAEYLRRRDKHLAYMHAYRAQKRGQ